MRPPASSGKPDTYQFDLVALEEGPVRADNGMLFQPTATIDTLDHAVDTLLVTGSHAVKDVTSNPRLMQWLQRQAIVVRRLGSVCLRRLAAGTRRPAGRPARHHPLEYFGLAGAALRAGAGSSTTRSTCATGISTPSAGVTAGMDLALALVEEDLGRNVALAVARELVMFIKRPGGQAQFSAHLACANRATQADPPSAGMGAGKTWKKN